MFLHLTVRILGRIFFGSTDLVLCVPTSKDEFLPVLLEECVSVSKCHQCLKPRRMLLELQKWRWLDDGVGSLSRSPSGRSENQIRGIKS